MRIFQRPRWRQFRPHAYRHRTELDQYQRRDRSHDAEYLGTPSDPQHVCVTTDIFDCAEDRVRLMMQRRPEMNDLDRKIDKLKKKFDRTGQPMDGLVALFAQAPRAVLAQLQMDKHPHGYQEKQAKLYELIDFNDTFDSVILALDDHNRERFVDKAKDAIDRTCARVGAPTFTDEQWQAIVRGLSREIAAYIAAKNSGFHTIMTPRSQDALGVDIQVMDPESNRYVNLDIKSPSAFRRRLEHLVREDRLTERELLAADERSYAVTLNGHGTNKVKVVVLGIVPDYFGMIDNFAFEDTKPMQAMLVRLINEHGLHDGRFGMIAS